MKNPQSLAIELNRQFPNSKMKAIGDFACCCFTLFWYLGLDFTDIEAIQTVGKLINKKVDNDICLDEECTVHWFPIIKALTGREVESISEKTITRLNGIKGKAIVKFGNGNNKHWGGVKNGVVVFDSLGKSKTIAEGKPELIKVIKIKGVK